MTRSIFMDVGAHFGETLDVVLDPRYGFEQVVCFEPSTSCVRLLRQFRDKRIWVFPAGLSDKTAKVALYGTGLLGASVYEGKKQPDEGLRPSEFVPLMRASEWIQLFTSEDDQVYLKLNCEGSECDVLDDILSSVVSNRLTAVYVDFDVRKIPGMAHRESQTRHALEQQGIPYVSPNHESIGGNPAVKQWLDGLKLPIPRNTKRDVVSYRLRTYLPFYILASKAARAVLPDKGLQLAARRFGRNAAARDGRSVINS